MYSNSIPFLIKNLNSLAKFLKKAEGIIETRKLDKSVVLGLRIYPDMFPLIRQVMLVTDFAKGAGARLAGMTPPSFPDEEKTFDELQARLTKTVDFLKTLDASAFDANHQITIKQAGQDVTMGAVDYFNGVALPNFYFHMTTAYNILRSIGIELGKGDFMGR